MSAFGPRATILKVGVCEQVDDDVWFMAGWSFDLHGDLSLVRPCPFLHDENHVHIGWLGWTFTDLRAISRAQMDLAQLETTDSPS